MDDTLLYTKAYMIKLHNIDSKSTYAKEYLFPQLQRIFDTELERRLVAIEETPCGKFEVMILFITYTKRLELMEILNSAPIDIVRYDYDISEEILMDDYSDPFAREISRMQEYKELFDNFRLKNLTINDVLDKKLLARELDLIDMEILSKYE